MRVPQGNQSGVHKNLEPASATGQRPPPKKSNPPLIRSKTGADNPFSSDVPRPNQRFAPDNPAPPRSDPPHKVASWRKSDTRTNGLCVTSVANFADQAKRALSFPCPLIPLPTHSPAHSFPCPLIPLPHSFPCPLIPAHSFPCPLIPLPTHSPAHSFPCPLIPLPTHSPAHSFPCPLIPLPTHSPAHSFPCPLIPLPTHSPAHSFPCPLIPLPTHSPAHSFPCPFIPLPSHSPALTFPCPHIPLPDPSVTAVVGSNSVCYPVKTAIAGTLLVKMLTARCAGIGLNTESYPQPMTLSRRN